MGTDFDCRDMPAGCPESGEAPQERSVWAEKKLGVEAGVESGHTADDICWGLGVVEDWTSSVEDGWLGEEGFPGGIHEWSVHILA